MAKRGRKKGDGVKRFEDKKHMTAVSLAYHHVKLLEDPLVPNKSAFIRFLLDAFLQQKENDPTLLSRVVERIEG